MNARIDGMDAPIGAAAAAEAGAARVGGKGWQLGLLARYGLPVPDFFAIPAGWSRHRAALLRKCVKKC